MSNVFDGDIGLRQSMICDDERKSTGALCAPATNAGNRLEGAVVVTRKQ